MLHVIRLKTRSPILPNNARPSTWLAIAPSLGVRMRRMISAKTADIEGCVPLSRCPDFELDRSTNLGSIFLQRTLSRKGLAGFSDYELSMQPRIAVDVDDGAPTEGD